jgi:hypothetical protein
MKIVPLYQIPINNIPTSQFFIEYVLPYQWEGHLWLDGGWGPKNEVQELISDDPLTGFKIPFLVAAKNTLIESTECDKKYHIAFPGNSWPHLVNFIEAVKQFGVKEQKYILSSYFTSDLPEEGTNIYQLSITVTQDLTTINIEKGKWIPSFDDSLIIAGW